MSQAVLSWLASGDLPESGGDVVLTLLQGLDERGSHFSVGLEDEEGVGSSCEGGGGAGRETESGK